MNPYAVMGISPEATIEHINATYRRMSKYMHPDVGGDADEFAKLTWAVEILRDPVRRASFDRDGTIEEPQKSEDAAAMEELCKHFQQALAMAAEQGVLGSIDVIARLRNAVESEIALQRDHREQALKAQRISAETVMRLSFNGGGPNVLRNVIERENERIGEIIQSMDKRISMLERAHVMANDWSWDFDKMPSQYAPVYGAVASQFNNTRTFYAP